ncbi:hypothetical protein AB0L44_41950 [Nonomuraea wenchangensis]|uniref:hypothetical protein n=1 Tax=Nonomuraea wenchangensis TaxID=568860 RepID=UPI0034343A78
MTKNIKRSETTVERGEDGSFKMRTVTDYHDPQGPLGAIVNIFRKGNDGTQQ